MKIKNLYKANDVLKHGRVYASEKIHGTSAFVRFAHGTLGFHSGGSKHEEFLKAFDQVALLERWKQLPAAVQGQYGADIGLNCDNFTVYGEAYGGKMQKMSATYGPVLKFVAFEVKSRHTWLTVAQAAFVVGVLGLDFVPYRIIETTFEALNAERDLESWQALKNGMGPGHKREGIVIRPLVEAFDKKGERIMAKHKGEAYRETKSSRPIDQERLKVLDEAQAIADEWVTPMRLTHVLDAFPEPTIQNTGDVVKAMLADIEVEAKGEIVMSKEARKAIGGFTVRLFHQRLQLP